MAGASLDHHYNKTLFPGDGTNVPPCIDKENILYVEDVRLYGGTTTISSVAAAIAGGPVLPTTILKSGAPFVNGEVGYATGPYQLDGSPNLTWNSGTNTLSALNLSVPTQSTLASATIGGNNFTMSSFVAGDLHKALYVSGTGVGAAVGLTPYTLPATATNNTLLGFDATNTKTYSAGSANLVINSGAGTVDVSANPTFSSVSVPSGSLVLTPAAPAGNYPVVSTGPGNVGYASYAIPTYTPGSDYTAALAAGEVVGIGATSTALTLVPTRRTNTLDPLNFYKSYVSGAANNMFIQDWTINASLTNTKSRLLGLDGSLGTASTNLVYDLRGFVGNFTVLPDMFLGNFNTDPSSVNLYLNCSDNTVFPPTGGTLLKTWSGTPFATYYTITGGGLNSKSITTANNGNPATSLSTDGQSISLLPGNNTLTLHFSCGSAVNCLVYVHSIYLNGQ